MIPRLPGLDQRHQNIQAVTFGRVALSRHQAFDLLERTAIVSVGFDWYDFHGASLKSIVHQWHRISGAAR